ncbi:MAG: glycosyltransferase [Chitinophagales bacterium]
MKQENFNLTEPLQGKYLPTGLSSPRKLRILIAPLDWGLGHATRCIPIIYELLQHSCEVWIATGGAQEILLKQEFPDLRFLPLTGYRVKYSGSAITMPWNILFQTRKILRAIKQENNWLKKMVDEHHFDAVISDNRYGLFHSSVPSIILTHQLNIKTNLGKWSENWLQKRNYKYINRFTECWVPDEESENNLAGELSHPKAKPIIPIRYIGPLSRFKKATELSDSSPGAGNLLILISGPEPQRTILEDKIIKDIAHYNGAATVIRGLPGNLNLIPSTNTIRFYNHLPAEALNKEMNKAEYIISRSGYSTIMDIRRLQRKAILIPTPGQTEQEYLAGYLQGKKMALVVSQKSFNLSLALQQAKSFSYSIEEDKGESDLTPIISQFVQSIHKH